MTTYKNIRFSLRHPVNMLEHICKCKIVRDFKILLFHFHIVWEGGEGKTSGKSTERGLNNIQVIK